MSNVLNELSNWASTLPYWEQGALDWLVSGSTLSESDYCKLLQYLLEDSNLEEPTDPRPALKFPQHNAEENASPIIPSIQLKRIYNFEHVNALVSGQSILFGPNLTVVFGANGSGKTSYVRVLACSAFARGEREVLPDATQPMDPSAVPSADIEICDGSSSRVFHYQGEGRCSELASLYVFDTTSVQIHLTKQNKLSFSPAGLSYLTQLADATDQVRSRLHQKVAECSEPHTFSFLFQGDSEVGRFIASLGPNTDLAQLRRLAAITPQERLRIHELDLNVARLKSQDTSAQIRDLEQTIKDMEGLTESIHRLEEGLGEEVIENANDAIRVYVEREIAAQRASTDQFKSEHFTHTGTATWRRFIEAAKALADAEQDDATNPYPQEGDYCLLCQQPLTPEARELIGRFWKFLADDAQSRFGQARLLLEQMHKTLASVNADFFDDQSVSYRYLQENDAKLLQSLVTFINACGQRREEALASVDSRTPRSPAPLPPSGADSVEAMVMALNRTLEELREQDPAREIERLEKEQRELQHRAILNEHYHEIKDYVEQRIWAERASRVGGSTRHITQKYNQLFNALVTQRYIEVFEQNLKELKRPLKVRVQTIAKKGETLRQIVLETDPSAPPDQFPLQKVLSEGEKRAVALADFLTEVMVDDASGGIVLDDPVTSLDFEWKDIIASRLVKEAEHRQVIVFTHDLHFLYLLKKYADNIPVELLTHWIRRGDGDDKPGYVYLDNSPALEHDYRSVKRAQKFYERAQKAPPEEQESLLKQGFGALRTTYEAFIVYELLAGVVTRFDERISCGPLRDIVWDKSLVDEVVERYEYLSRYIEGHLHSDVYSSQKVTPKVLCDEIETFITLRKRLAALKKEK